MMLRQAHPDMVKIININKKLSDNDLVAALLEDPNYLNLSGNKIHGFLTRPSLDRLKATQQLFVLKLAHNLIDYLCSSDLIEGVSSNTSLLILDLTGNNLGNKGAAFLLKSIVDNVESRIQVLNLADNNIDSLEECAVNQLLTQNNSLRVLILDNNPLNTLLGDDPTITHLFTALKSNTTLEELSLSRVKLAEQHLPYLIDSLVTNTTLKKLNLSGALSNLSPTKVIAFISSISQKSNFILNLGILPKELISQISVHEPGISFICDWRNNSASGRPSINNSNCLYFTSLKEVDMDAEAADLKTIFSRKY